MTTAIRTNEDNQAGAVVFAGVDNITLKATGPELLGTPKAPTASAGANTTQIATTAFVTAAMAAAGNVLPSDTTPAAASGTGSSGTSAKYSRGDHVHPAVASDTQPSDTVPNAVSNTGSAGTNVKYSRADHVHANNVVPSDANPQGVGSAPIAGASALYARADHVHAYVNPNPTPVLPSNTNPIVDSVANPGTSALYARGDHVHPQFTSPSSVTPAAPSVAGAVGTSNNYARADHAHPAGAQSFAQSGYITLPGGLILQWGFATFGPSGSLVNFPVPFASTVYSVTATPVTSGTIEACVTYGPTNSGFTGKTVGNLGCNWMAIGK